jgi:hypothetical protein
VRAPHEPVPPPLRHDHSGLVTIVTFCTFCTFVMRDNEPSDLVEFHLSSSVFLFFSCGFFFFLFSLLAEPFFLFSFLCLVVSFFTFFCCFAFFAF